MRSRLSKVEPVRFRNRTMILHANTAPLKEPTKLVAVVVPPFKTADADARRANLTTTRLPLLFKIRQVSDRAGYRGFRPPRFPAKIVCRQILWQRRGARAAGDGAFVLRDFRRLQVHSHVPPRQSRAVRSTRTMVPDGSRLRRAALDQLSGFALGQEGAGWQQRLCADEDPELPQGIVLSKAHRRSRSVMA